MKRFSSKKSNLIKYSYGCQTSRVNSEHSSGPPGGFSGISKPRHKFQAWDSCITRPYIWAWVNKTIALLADMLGLMEGCKTYLKGVVNGNSALRAYPM